MTSGVLMSGGDFLHVRGTGSLLFQAAATDTPVDWSSWDGTNNGAVTNLFTVSGTIRGQDIAAVSDTEAILFYKDDNEATNKGRAVVLDVVSDAMEDNNTDIALSIVNPTGLNIVRMTTSRFLCMAEDDATNIIEFSLLSKSGKTLTEEDNTTSGIPADPSTQQFRNSAARLNDTQAVFITRDGTDTNDGRIAVVDITGDTLTVGALVDLNDNVIDYPAICRLTDTSFMCVTQKTVSYCTVSGTTITVQGSINLIAAGTVHDDIMAQRIDDDTAIISYEKSGSYVDVNTFSWNGSSIDRGTPQSDLFGAATPAIFQGTGTSTDLGNRQVMFAARQDNETPRHGASVVCVVDESNNITVGTEVQISGAVIADHTTIDATPDGTLVFFAYQDETTSPVQQVGTRVIKP